MQDEEATLEYKGFVWYNNPDIFGDNNDGELQGFLDDDWEIDIMSNPVVKGERVVVFLSLVKEVDEEEDS